MMTACAQNLRNERGEGGGVVAVRRKTGRSVKMAKMAAQIFGIATVGSQENSCSTLLTSVSYAKWPTAFVGGVSYGKSRFMHAIIILCSTAPVFIRNFGNAAGTPTQVPPPH